jgi:transcriptional regulator with GAF, ATPase, and Fis domain
MSAHPISTGKEPRPFERLITDVSLPFINSSGAHLDTNIEAALKAICSSLQLDFSALAQWDKASESFAITHSWVLNGSASGRRFSQKDVPWLAYSILRGKSIQFGRTSKFSSEATKDVEAVCHSGIESALLFPLKSDDQVLGFVCFASSRVARDCGRLCQYAGAESYRR